MASACCGQQCAVGCPISSGIAASRGLPRPSATGYATGWVMTCWPWLRLEIPVWWIPMACARCCANIAREAWIIRNLSGLPTPIFAGARMSPVDCMSRADGILLVLPSLERGGGERVMLQLARSFLAAGREVHLAVLLGGGPLRGEVPDAAVLHELIPAGHARGFALARRVFPKLVSLMRAMRPNAVLSTMTGTNLLTVLACKQSHARPQLVLREASSIINARGFIKQKAMRWLYRRADVVIAVSRGVAGDLRSLGIPDDQIRVIHNPVDRDRLR